MITVPRYLVMVIYTLFFFTPKALAIPPAEDIPEEVLATEIIINARSAFNNKPLTPQEYALEKKQNQSSPFPPEVNSELRHNIFLLRLLKLIRTITP